MVTLLEDAWTAKRITLARPIRRAREGSGSFLEGPVEGPLSRTYSRILRATQTKLVCALDLF
jgi:hypothetical protein